MATLRNATSGRDLSESVQRPSDPLGRLVGALRYRSIAPHEGIWLEPCSGVHTLGMRATIDIVFLDCQHVVIGVESGVKPNRPLLWRRRAHTVLEMGTGFLAGNPLAVGDQLTLDETTAVVRGDRC